MPFIYLFVKSISYCYAISILHFLFRKRENRLSHENANAPQLLILNM